MCRSLPVVKAEVIALPQAQTAIPPSTSDFVNMDQLSGAEDTHRRATDKGEKVLGREHPNILESVHDPVDTLLPQGECEVAGGTFQQVLSRRENGEEGEYPDNLDSILYPSSSLLGRGKYRAAEALLRRTVEVSERVLGNEHPKTRAIIVLG